MKLKISLYYINNDEVIGDELLICGFHIKGQRVYLPPLMFMQTPVI